jgi:hypothetical protein
MTESLPDFEAPTVPEAPAPRKSRRKPARRVNSRTRKSTISPKRRAKAGKADRRTKAYRAAHPRVEQIAPKPSEAETVLSLLALLGRHDADAKRRILTRAGQLA